MKSFKLFLSAALAIATLAFASAASAGCDYGLECNTIPSTLPPAVAAPMGITLGGWIQSGVVGAAQTTGQGSTVFGEAITKTDEKFTLGAESFLTGNANPDCSVACKDSQSKLSITGMSMVGASTLGYASGNGTTPVTSQSMTGTNGAFRASLSQFWTGTPAPAAAP